MVNSISQTPAMQPNTVAKQPSKTTKTSIFYVNDIHSNLINLEKLKSASDTFDATPANGSDKLKFSAGDISVGRDETFSRLGVAFQNVTNIMASAGGNHEFDLKKEDLVEVLKDNHYKLLGMNVNIPETSKENKEIKKEIINSYVQEQNGTKYGVIGIMPFNFMFHLSDPQEYEDFDIMQMEKTIPLIQKEINTMKEQGINKIILLSHAGYAEDTQLAQSIEGIDVIIGGHTHDLVEGIKEGKNLFYSKKTGEPTIITQAGMNGKYFGVLNLEFDEKGVIKSAQNNVTKTSIYPKNLVMKYYIDKIIGKPEVVGTIKSAPKHVHTLIDENPGVNFLADAERSELGVDIVMINAGNIRAVIEEGPITNRDLQTITPFDNKLWIMKLNEKDLVDAIKIGAKSLVSVDNTPGILQFSGIKYTMTKKGEIKAASFMDKDGKETPIDVKNPNPFKTYRVAVDDFIAKGGNGYIKENPNAIEKKFDFDKNKVITDYLKKHPDVVISKEKRITIEE